jgi:hypothetical protein
MGRTVILAFALAVFAAVSAYGSTASTPRTHRKAASERSPHRPLSATHRTESPASARPETARTAGQRARRLTPEEVGRAAGLNIRRQLARASGARQSSSRATSYRRARYRESSRYRRPRAVRVSLREPVLPSRIASGNPEPADADVEQPSEVEPGLANGASRAGEMPAAAPQPGQAADRASTDQNADRTADRVADDGASDEGASAPIRPGAPSARAAAQPNPAGSSVAPGEEESTEDLAPETSPRGDEENEEASLVIPRGAMPAPLRGSLASLQRQNSKLDAEGLERIEDEDDLAARIAHGLLVPVPVSSALTVNEELPLNHRYCRPWTAHFLADLAREHDAAFHRPLEVSSAVRTVEYQQRLMRINGNAAPAEGDIVSPHLTGATIDIAKQGLTRAELGWMRRRLLALQSEGKIDVEEEFRQACFHITVYKTYDPIRSVRPAHKTSEAAEPQAAPDADGDASTQGF